MFTYRQSSARRWLAAVVPGRLVVWESGGPVVPAEIWSTLREEGIGAVLVRFAGSDLYSCPPFALVEWTGELGESAEVRVLLKGPYDFTAHTADGPVVLSGEGKLTWLEHTLTGVRGFSIACDEVLDDELELPLGEGAAWVSRVSAGMLHSPEDAPAAAEANAGTETGPVGDGAPSDDAAAAAESQRDYEELFNAIRTAEETSAQDTSAHEISAHEVSAPPDRELEPVPFDGHDESRGSEAAVSAELKRLRSHGLRPRGGHIEDSPYSFTMTGGTREPFAGVVLVGRSPNASSAIGTDYPRLITVDAGQDISRNHVQFTADHDELVVTDLKSRNGTIVVPPQGDPQRLNPGEPTIVAPGTVVDLGQGITILLERD